MAFPTIPTVANGRLLTSNQANTTAARTFPNLSSLTKNAGDLLVAIVIAYQSSTTNAQFGSWGGGFTEIHDTGTSSTLAIGVATQWSTGSETGTFTVTQSDTVTGHATMILLSIPGAHATTQPEVLVRTNATTTAANPAAANPANWDVEDTLWISVAGSGETATTGLYTGVANTPPTNFTDSVVTTITADVVGGVNAGIAFRQNAVASEDVGAWSVDTTQARNSAFVIAVRPAAIENVEKSDSDSPTISLTETTDVTIQADISNSDSTTATLNESASINATAAVTDTISASLTENVAISSAITDSDSFVVSTTEVAGIENTFSSSDTATISLVEDTSISLGITSEDIITTTLTETTDIAQTAFINSADTINAVLTEGTGGNYYDTITADGPYAHWKLGESSGTVAEDSTTNNLDGTYIGSPQLGVNGIPGTDVDTAVLFDGVSQRVDISTNSNYWPTATNGVAYEFWYRGTDTGNDAGGGTVGTNAGLLAGNDGTSNKRFAIGLDASGKVRAHVGGNYNLFASTTAINDNDDHHVVLLWRGSNYWTYLYIDGVLESSGSPGNAGQGAPLLRIGYNARASGYAAGVIDEVAIYTTGLVPLSEERIAAHYAAGKNPPAGQQVVVYLSVSDDITISLTEDSVIDTGEVSKSSSETISVTLTESETPITVYVGRFELSGTLYPGENVYPGSSLYPGAGTGGYIGEEVLDALTISLAENEAVDTGEASKSSNDAVAVSLTENVAISSALTNSDTATTGLVETTSISISVNDSDTLTVVLVESGSVGATLTASDIATTALTENTSVAVTNYVTSSDTITPALTETVSVNATANASDSVTAGLTETTSVVVSQAASDSLAVSLTEAASIAATLTNSDTLAVSLTENTNVAQTISKSSADSLSIAIAETASIAAALTTTDSIAAALNETASIASTLSANDSITISITEDASTGGTAYKNSSDSLLTTLNESVSINGTTSASDAVAPSLSESAAVTISFSASDSVAATLTESGSVNASASASDNIATSITDTAVITIGVSSSDTATVVLTETGTLGGAFGYEDVYITLTEAAAIQAAVTNSDAISVSIAESGSLGDIPKSSSDDIAITLDESAALIKTVGSSDVINVTLIEAAGVNGTLANADAVVVSLDEGVDTTGTVVSSDTMPVTLTESAFLLANIFDDQTIVMDIDDDAAWYELVEKTSNDILAIIINDVGEVEGNISIPYPTRQRHDYTMRYLKYGAGGSWITKQHRRVFSE